MNALVGMTEVPAIPTRALTSQKVRGASKEDVGLMEPSPQVANLLDKVGASRVRGMSRGITAVKEREAEFQNLLEMQLAGVALDRGARDYADELLDRWWKEDRGRELYDANMPFPQGREVVVGSGYHAAVYCATRVLAGNPKPLVLERSNHPGGVFAATPQPVFYLNSRNRAGGPGSAGDIDTQPNYLPGAPIQASMVSAREYHTNNDMAFVIRLTLAQYADVIPGADVKRVLSRASIGGQPIDGESVIELTEGEKIPALRIIDARGLGDPMYTSTGGKILNFQEFMQRMGKPWPLRGIRRIAVVGGGDGGRVAVEAILGIGPEPYMAAAGLDHVDRVDWYARGIAQVCNTWVGTERGRYQGIGRFLREDAYGRKRLYVVNRRVDPVSLPNSTVIGGKSYDMVVMATGNYVRPVTGLIDNDGEVGSIYVTGGEVVALRSDYDQRVYAVGPHANIGWSALERNSGEAGIENNRTSMYRLGTRTAALAAQLEKTPRKTMPSGRRGFYVA